MGSKGMLSVDYELSGHAICLRPSMIKFEAPESRQIKIGQAFVKLGRYFSNRPLIMSLEGMPIVLSVSCSLMPNIFFFTGLSVPYDVFKKYHDRSESETQQSTESLGQAAGMLESYGLGTSYRLPSVVLGLDQMGIEILRDDLFYQRMLEFAVHHIL